MKRMKRSGLILFLVCSMVCLISASVLAQKAETTTAPAVPAAPATGEEETDIVAGKIATVDAAINTLTVTDEAGKSYTLTATKEETSIWKGDDTIELSALKAGDSVELEYYKDKDGKLVAIWVDVLTKEAAAPEETKAPETTQPPATEPAPAATE